MTANAGVVARGLLRRIASCSPLAAGLAAGVGSAVALYALHACIEGQLDALPGVGMLPQVNGCHCWLIGVAGFFLGVAFALAMAVVRRLLEPLVALLCESRFPLRRQNAAAAVSLLRFAYRFAHTRRPLARRLAGRAPPLAA